MEGAPAGSDGAMSEKGWSNSSVFEQYITQHFSKHASLSEGEDRPATLLLYDGHKSHISLTLTEWARKRNVILFVLPPHTSHITQPLDVGVFGPLKSYYYKECQAYLQRNPGINITRYEVASLTAKPYIKALSPDNITSAFRKAGIYPFDKEKITPSQVAPAKIYQTDQHADTGPIAENEEPEPEQNQKETDLPEKEQKSAANTFLDGRKITKTLENRPKKRFFTPYSITGDLATEQNTEFLKSQAVKKATPKKSVKAKKTSNKYSHEPQPQPSTSTGVTHSSGPMLIEDESEPEESEEEDTDVCCVCGKFSPEGRPTLDYILLVKWGQCDKCDGWVHLSFCSPVRALRRGSPFLCPHCDH